LRDKTGLTVVSIWTSLESSIDETCNDILGNSRRHHQYWFDNNSAEINQRMKQKQAKFCSWQDYFQNKENKHWHHSVKADFQRQIHKR